MRTCPHFIDGQTAGAGSLCIGGVIPFEPSASIQTEALQVLGRATGEQAVTTAHVTTAAQFSQTLPFTPPF